MALIKFNDYVPVRFNSLIDDLLDDALAASKERTYRPLADILENDGSFHINLVLPGVEKKDVELNVNENVLTVKTTDKENKSDDSVKYHLREISDRRFERSFRLPENVKEDKIKANLENGILNIEIPKDKEKPLKRTITIG